MRQGSAFMAQDCKKQQKDYFMLRELLLVVRSGPTERRMSGHTPSGLLNMVAELEAKEVSRGSMDSLRTDLPTEAARERRKKRHSGFRGWRKRCVKHRSGKKP